MKSAEFWMVPALALAVSLFGGIVGCGESNGGTGGAAGSEAPVITKVQWDWALPCEDTTSAVTVTVSATDDDTAQLSLMYLVSISDCTPELFGGNVTDIAILECPPRNPDVRRSAVT